LLLVVVEEQAVLTSPQRALEVQMAAA